jgi:hypothetical protein
MQAETSLVSRILFGHMLLRAQETGGRKANTCQDVCGFIQFRQANSRIVYLTLNLKLSLCLICAVLPLASSFGPLYSPLRARSSAPLLPNIRPSRITERPTAQLQGVGEDGASSPTHVMCSQAPQRYNRGIQAAVELPKHTTMAFRKDKNNI